MAELVPYKDGMTLGQGYNTFLQQSRTHGAVKVENEEEPDQPYKVEYYEEEVSSYQKLVESLSINAGATISGWGQSATIDTAFLDRSEFETSTFNWIVRVNITRQGIPAVSYAFNKLDTDDPNETYGNRFIAGYQTGGFLFIRFSITLTNASQTKELTNSVKAAFSMYGITGEPSLEVKQAAEKVERSSTIKTTIIEYTGGGKYRRGNPAAEPGEAIFLKLKQKADDFRAGAEDGRHSYKRYALLEKYTNLSDFGNHFDPFDYSRATDLSWRLLNDFTLYTGFEALVTDIPDNKYAEGSSKKNELIKIRAEEADKIRQKVLSISKDPNEAETLGEYLPAPDFQLQVFSAIKRATYIVQKLSFGNTGQYTEYANTSLDSGATETYQLEAFDFEDVVGTTLVSFGKNRSSDDYAAQIGIRVTSNPDYEEKCALWVFAEQFDRFAETGILVYGARTSNVVRVQKGNPSELPNVPGRPFFYFNVAAAT